MLTNVLVPLDGSEVAEKAIDYARQITDRGGQIILLTVVDMPDYPATMFYPAGIAAYEITRETAEDELVPQADSYLHKMAESLRQAGFRVTTETVIGEPACAIVEKADERDVQAIVMSTHGRSGLGRWLFGSVANKVLNATNRPIFIVPVRHR